MGVWASLRFELDSQGPFLALRVCHPLTDKARCSHLVSEHNYPLKLEQVIRWRCCRGWQ